MGFFIGVNTSMNPTQQDWIYESPDSGKTVFRRKIGSLEREEITPPKLKRTYDEFMWEFRNEFDHLAKKHPAVKEQLDKLITIMALIKE